MKLFAAAAFIAIVATACTKVEPEPARTWVEYDACVSAQYHDLGLNFLTLDEIGTLMDRAGVDSAYVDIVKAVREQCSIIRPVPRPDNE